jgi:hypothetical protein
MDPRKKVIRKRGIVKFLETPKINSQAPKQNKTKQNMCVLPPVPPSWSQQKRLATRPHFPDDVPRTVTLTERAIRSIPAARALATITLSCQLVERTVEHCPVSAWDQVNYLSSATLTHTHTHTHTGWPGIFFLPICKFFSVSCTTIKTR